MLFSSLEESAVAKSDFIMKNEESPEVFFFLFLDQFAFIICITLMKARPAHIPQQNPLFFLFLLHCDSLHDN